MPAKHRTPCIMDSTPELRSLSASHGAAYRHYGPDHKKTKAAKVALERQRLKDERARLDRLAAEVRDLENEVAK